MTIKPTSCLHFFAIPQCASSINKKCNLDSDFPKGQVKKCCLRLFLAQIDTDRHRQTTVNKTVQMQRNGWEMPNKHCSFRKQNTATFSSGNSGRSSETCVVISLSLKTSLCCDTKQDNTSAILRNKIRAEFDAMSLFVQSIPVKTRAAVYHLESCEATCAIAHRAFFFLIQAPTMLLKNTLWFTCELPSLSKLIIGLDSLGMTVHFGTCWSGSLKLHTAPVYSRMRGCAYWRYLLLQCPHLKPVLSFYLCHFSPRGCLLVVA